MSSEKLVSAYIQRIVRVNGYINAMVMDNFADAQQKALEVDRYLDGLDTSSEEYAKVEILILNKAISRNSFLCESVLRSFIDFIL